MSATPNFAAANFNQQFKAIKNELTYNSNWANGTGYYTNAIRGESAVKLKPGEVAKCQSPNDRKMIFIGTRFGTMVVFQRFSGGDKGVHVLNAPLALTRLKLFDTAGGITEKDMVRIIGSQWESKPMNIGMLIEMIIEAANTHNPEYEEVM